MLEGCAGSLSELDFSTVSRSLLNTFTNQELLSVDLNHMFVFLSIFDFCTCGYQYQILSILIYGSSMEVAAINLV